MPRSVASYTTVDVESGGDDGAEGLLDPSPADAKPLLPDSRKDGKPLRPPAELLSGCCYCLTSMGMVLLNKAVLSSFAFRAPNSLLFFQFAFAFGAICVCRAMRWVPSDPPSWRVAKMWLPVNVVFVGMVWTSFLALGRLSVAMVTLLKNSTNFLVILGDLLLFGKRHNAGVWASVCLIVASSLVGGITDVSFSPSGYTWQILNCCFTAGYSLSVKLTMERICAATGKAKAMEESTMVLYNNGMALPWILMLMVHSGETHTLWSQPDLYKPTFQLAALVSGILGFMISFASLWFLSNTAATTFSLVGSLNKIPTAILGMVLFNNPATTSNVLSVLVGLAAGVMFVTAKSRS